MRLILRGAMKAERIRRYKDGLWAETAAAWYLRLKGYRVLARRFKAPMGEIDIVVRKKSILAFVEVKRRATHDDAVLSVSPRTQMRIFNAAKLYLAQHGDLYSCNIRFDVVTVTPSGLRHIDNAWQPPA